MSDTASTEAPAAGATPVLFGPDADFEPMLGKIGKGVALDNVYQSATIIIDEQGGEAAAATGAPLFVGKIADPTQH